jgi:hypothetical protein
VFLIRGRERVGEYFLEKINSRERADAADYADYGLNLFDFLLDKSPGNSRGF